MLTWAICYLAKSEHIKGDVGCILLIAMGLDTFMVTIVAYYWLGGK